MKTKNKIECLRNRYILVGLSLCLLLASCIESDLLDTSDPMAISDEEAWTTEYLTQLCMNGVYAGLRLGMGETGYDYYQFDYLTLTMPRNSVNHTNLIWGGSTSSDGLFLNVWRKMYEAIFRCNDAINSIPVKSECSESKKEQYIAEARFLRAYFYSKLNMLYRGVPLYDEIMTIEIADKPRSSEQEVWNFIVADLNYCIEGNKIPNKYDAGDSNYGRVSKGAAYALRGKVYMWMKEYEKAIADFEATEQCGYSLFQGDYKTLFKEANEQCDEMIFSVQNMNRSGYGSSSQFYAGHRSAKGSNWNAYMVQPYAVDLYETADGNPFSWDDIIPGYSRMDPDEREVYFLRDSEGIEELLIQNGFEGNIDTEAAAVREAIQIRLNGMKAETQALYLPKGNEERIRQAYENRDPRLTANVITPYSDFLGYYSGTGDNIVTMRWPYRNEAPAGLRDLRTDTQNNFFYLHRKWVYEGDGEITNREYGATDFPILRLADVILLRAEALAELGRSQEAMDQVNRIRRRVGMPDITSANDLIDRIRNERKVELFNEGQNLFDELRWGTLKQSKFETPDPGCVNIWGGIVRPYVTPSDAQTRYWPIPASEIEKNPALTQNEGW